MPRENKFLKKVNEAHFHFILKKYEYYLDNCYRDSNSVWGNVVFDLGLANTFANRLACYVNYKRLKEEKTKKINPDEKSDITDEVDYRYKKNETLPSESLQTTVEENTTDSTPYMGKDSINYEENPWDSSIDIHLSQCSNRESMNFGEFKDLDTSSQCEFGEDHDYNIRSFESDSNTVPEGGNIIDNSLFEDNIKNENELYDLNENLNLDNLSISVTENKKVLEGGNILNNSLSEDNFEENEKNDKHELHELDENLNLDNMNTSVTENKKVDANLSGTDLENGDTYNSLSSSAKEIDILGSGNEEEPTEESCIVATADSNLERGSVSSIKKNYARPSIILVTFPTQIMFQKEKKSIANLAAKASRGTG